ncbi:hypothetical protein FB451DRAFT_1182188 [Mycena latifolia]|nr:hypothetical protein FB451DRAFT_1182188 [Mycena latifolia]
MAVHDFLSIPGISFQDRSSRKHLIKRRVTAPRNSPILSLTVPKGKKYQPAQVPHVCFLTEIVAVAYLISRRQKTKKKSLYEDGTLSFAEKFLPSSAQDDTYSQSHLPRTHTSVRDTFQSESSDSYVRGEQRSTIDITVYQPSPLLHTQFPGTPPETVPGTPIISSNIFTDRQTWVAGGELDQPAVIRRLPSPWQYPQAARAVIATLAIEGRSDVSDAGENSEKIGLERLVANLRARIRELENQARAAEMQQKLLRGEVLLGLAAPVIEFQQESTKDSDSWLDLQLTVQANSKLDIQQTRRW